MSELEINTILDTNHIIEEKNTKHRPWHKTILGGYSGAVANPDTEMKFVLVDYLGECGVP
jgi:hypothetical protein